MKVPRLPLIVELVGAESEISAKKEWITNQNTKKCVCSTSYRTYQLCPVRLLGVKYKSGHEFSPNVDLHNGCVQ